MMSNILKQINKTNYFKVLQSNVLNKTRLYTTSRFNNEKNEESKGFQFKSEKVKNENNNNNKKNNKNNNNNIIIYSFSIGGIFNSLGNNNKNEEIENPYGNISNRIIGKNIETFEEALDWYTRYYIQPEPEQFLVAMKLLLGKQSKTFVRQQLNNIKEESDMKSIARISTIQSFYYLPLVGFMIEMFRQNPKQVEKWYKELTSDKEISTPIKSGLGDLDAVMLINLAVLLAETPTTIALESKILSNYYNDKDTAESKKLKAEKFKGWAVAQKKSISSLPLILIGEYFASGKEDLVKQVSSIWRSSLDNLEVMGIQNTEQANTQNNVAKRLEFQNRELIIEQLNQAIRLLSKDQRALNVLKTEVEHQIKEKEERIKQYK
ncbi:hypothetical protein DDB_G0291151 [Dictyostelium discoideum AX4]|uniref:Uncharacterized protein n=1 Tax=Dictyostelium discoideum TaxID=44689 RepID=Q54F29_DICDI|nr:hypothetical protein DDB_G0291151 [Dictyostelium discoideum AX4]EAL61859.1 hypothetical protein DDB_G0291151 [Dictyostelium discoideum AX4]|eukprot:XP_635361.1 hypothetical protein DDB_G0291151 [Dictyostelium discoideum AX4]